jgi:hypothetical protein
MENEMEELSVCCEAPIFWELQDDTDILSGIPVCEVCGEVQE